jgi:hypothetical protein
MTQAQQTVTDAKQTLKNAEANLARSQRDEAVRQLKEVRTQGRRLKRELDEAVKAVHRADADATNAEFELVQINDAMQEHIASPPDPADFPSDATLAAWEQQHQALNTTRGEVVARKRDAQSAGAEPRMRAIRLDAAIVTLRYKQANLERIVRGERVASGWEGGVRRVPA